MKLTIKGSGHDIREFLCKTLGCHQRQRVRFWSISFGQDELIPKVKMKLTKPIKPGFRRPFTIVPDEAVDANDQGGFVKVNTLAGDSTVTIDPTSTATEIKGWLNGDGAVGDKSVEFVVDGHVGPGEVQVSLTVDFSVAHPDATVLGFTEGTDEPIPAQG